MFVYWIRHKTNPSLIYVGSTEDFDKRIIQHKTDCYNENCRAYNHKKYKIIRANGGFDMFDIHIIDVVCTEDKLVLHQLEQYYIDHFKSLESMNSHNAVHNEEYQRLYREANRAEINAKKILHYEAKRTEIRAKQSLYYEANCAEIIAKQRAKRSYNSEAKRLLSIDI